MNILDKIVAKKQEEVSLRKSLTPIKKLEQSVHFEAPTVSLESYLRRVDKSGIIAEFKRRSPSKPTINLYADVENVSIGYMQSGASALSILTDESFFGGRDTDLQTARKFNYCPILRKDFIIDEYQIIEAKSIGADAILLIASILTKNQIQQLYSAAHALNLEVLLEIHHESELEKIENNYNILGINNRNLDTFETDYRHSLQMIEKLPKGVCKISESGLHQIEHLLELKQAGYHGFLIGERFMKSADPVHSCSQFIEAYQRLLTKELSIA